MSDVESDIIVDCRSAIRTVRLRHRDVPVVLPNRHDPRLHLAAVIVTIHVLGQTVFDFRVSVVQILAAVLTCALIETTVVFWRQGRLVWPASAMLTGSGIGLILRANGTASGHPWSTYRWYVFAAVAAFSIATKYLVRVRSRPLFNPSNVGLVVAFVALGSGRVEPLEFWWGPFDVWMAAAYLVIIVGGLRITRRLDLFAMGTAFWCTLAVGVGALAWSGHAITARWSVLPLGGLHLWWVIVTSPEILVFLFFMLTDPRTVPAGRTGRVAFGVGVGVASTLLLAPARTEFEAKVGVLSGLLVMCMCRPAFDRVFPAPSSPIDRPWLYFIDTFGAAAATSRPRVGSAVGRAICCLPLFALAAIVAGHRANAPGFQLDIGSLPDCTAVVPRSSNAKLPPITVDPAVGAFGEDLLGSGATRLAQALLFDLDCEDAALRGRDSDLLRAVDHGLRLHDTQQRLEQAGNGPVEVTTYIFDSLDLVVVRPAGQGSALVGIEAWGIASVTTYDHDRHEQGRVTEPSALVFAMRKVDEMRWLIADVRALG